MTLDWQLRRSQLNHHWLKNEFSRHLRAFITRLAAREPDPGRIAEFLKEDWPMFAANHGALLDLLSSAEDALSPRQLIDLPPLSRCPQQTRYWLGRLVHALWLARSPIREKVRNVRRALDASFRTYLELSAFISEPFDLDQLRSMYASFQAFEVEVQRVCICLSRLPREVQVA
jgi:hypothetical protein